MILMLCVVFMMQLLLQQEVMSCEPWEYAVKDECCPKCTAGHRVLQHCTATSSTKCVSCTEGWFTDHPNGLPMCFKCHVCDPGAHLQIKEPCIYWRNTECMCRPGYYCVHLFENSCDRCIKHTISPAGFKVLQAGTEINDTIFEPCPHGSFSAMEMSLSCEKWTNCSEKGWIEKQAGTPTANAICEPHNPQPMNPAFLPAVISACIFLVLILVLVLVLAGVWKYRMHLRKAATAPERREEVLHAIPEIECMVPPIQETTQSFGQPCFARS